MKQDIFISYRRNGGEYTAKILRDRLTDAGYQVFFDVESLRSGNFNTKLYSVIDECTDVIVVLSPNALERCSNEGDWVRREVEYALEKGKNVIPVMLRGFTFPDVLPSSMEPLRYQNGLEANSQFFDAFLEQLQRKFLKTKPTFWRRLIQNDLFRRTLPLLLALLLLLGLVLGGAFLLDRQKRIYPRTEEQKNLTHEALYYVQTNLTAINMIGEAAEEALDSVERYINGGEKDYSALYDTLERAINNLLFVNLEDSVFQESLREDMKDSPFDTAEFTAIHDQAVSFQKEWLDHVDFLREYLRPEYSFDAQEKLEILDCYRIFLEETLEAYALCANEMLLPVTDDSAMQEFWHEYLPYQTALPLSAKEWQQDVSVLESAIEAALTRQEKANLKLASLVGDAKMAVNAIEKELVSFLVQKGFTEDEAREVIKTKTDVVESINGLRSRLFPADGDSADMVWVKMSYQLGYGFYEDAKTSAEICGELRAEDENAEIYMPILKEYIGFCQAEGMIPGVMVMGHYLPEGVNEALAVGDIIISLEGSPCTNFEIFDQLRNQHSGQPYTLGILRREAGGSFAELDVEITPGMPRVLLSTLVSVTE